MTAAAERYTAVAVALHWAIAAAIVLNLVVGAWMHEAIEDAATRGAAIAAYQLHKSVGLTVLALSVLRLAWRLAHRPPPLPATMRAWERAVARGVHWAFYALMLAVPLSGWLYVSTQWRDAAPLNVPTLWFGLFEVPHLLGLNTLAGETRHALAEPLEEAHELLAWAMGGLLVLHVVAALKHRFVDRDAVYASMRPLAGAIVAVLVVATIVAVGATSRTPAAGAVAESIRGVPGGWVIEPGSEIAFAGEHAGTPFRGRFTRWEADIRLDPGGAPSVAVTVETASATDGVALHDETLREAEWFDTGRHPQARYRAVRAAPRAGGGYAIEGTLTIKDRTLAVPPLAAVAGAEGLRITGSFELDRAEANLGMESDPSGEYVSRRILVDIDVTATPPR